MAAQPDAFSMASPIPMSPLRRPQWLLHTPSPAEDHDSGGSPSSSPATTHSAERWSSDMSPCSRCSSCTDTPTSISSAPSSQTNLDLSGGICPFMRMPGGGSRSPRLDVQVDAGSPLDTEQMFKAFVLSDGVDSKRFGGGNKEQAEHVHNAHLPAVSPAPLSRNNCTNGNALLPLLKPGEHRFASTDTVSSTAKDEGCVRVSATTALNFSDIPGNTESPGACSDNARAYSQIPATVNASPVSSFTFSPAPSPRPSSSSSSPSPLSTIIPPADFRPLETRSRALTTSHTPSPPTSRPSHSHPSSSISLTTIRPLPSPPIQPLTWCGRPIRPLPRLPSMSAAPTVPASAPPAITTTPIPKIRLSPSPNTSPSPSVAPSAGDVMPTRVVLSPRPYQTSHTPVQIPRPISTPPILSRTHAHTTARPRPSPLRFASVPPTAVAPLAEAPRKSENTTNEPRYDGVVIIQDDEDASTDLSPVQFAAPSSSCSSIDSWLGGPVPNQRGHTHGRVAAQADGNADGEPVWTKDSYQRTVPRATWTPPPQDEWVCSESGRWHLSFHDRRTSTSRSSALVVPTNPVLLQSRRGGQTPGMKPKGKPYLKVKVPNLSQFKKYTL